MVKQNNIRLGFFVGLFLISGCNDGFFPEGLYGYQVERLLSAGSEKVWFDQTTESGCEGLDLQLHFILAGDSVYVNEIVPECEFGINTDTLFYGKASASESNLYFTDTLKFTSGEFWLIDEITTDRLEIIKNESVILYTH